MSIRGELATDISVYDIVEVVTNPRQEEPNMATVLEIKIVDGSVFAVIQYHWNSCGPQEVDIEYLTVRPRGPGRRVNCI